ncbi:SAM-dependent methyltransferase [Pacificimonas sp. WHA3]|uniref:SAM-dependent methyltransferase n=2 Tax=Pacificimonas pallii TaxID=2827236 RepID=A0ABS6SB27_9SPHN|nr:SAM-dependent methyltransferase [Pacificimonas pallii]MBV7255559.1 SAM-dependent methyltransferase [Pacificimonas pallii]
MERSNTAYYAARDPLGAAGDFTTAPEISQIFGELVGAWIADLWQRVGAPARFRLIELGPGRGTLMADALRASRHVPGFQDAALVTFVETSPVLRAAQAGIVPGADHARSLADIPDDMPLIVIANEFFDALPVRQYGRGAGGWRELTVAAKDGRLAREPAPEHVREACPAGEAIAAMAGARILRQGGAMLVIDYGYSGGEAGDTLQAVKAHRKIDPFASPGTADLTAHVDFQALVNAAGTDVRAYGPVTQAAFLSALGIGVRAEALMRRADDAGRKIIASAVHRLTAPDQMGALFKVMALVHPEWPPPAGFAV